MTDLRKAAEEAAKVLANALSIDFNDKRDWYSYKHDVKYAANLLCQALAQKQTKCPRCGEVNPAEIHTCSPQVAQSEQKPVAYLCENAVGYKYFRWKKPTSHYKPIALYTAPPSKEWVGLTDAELAEFSDMKLGAYDLCLEVEAKLMEKNT